MTNRAKLKRIRELMHPDAMRERGMQPLNPNDPESVEEWAAVIAIRTARIREILGIKDAPRTYASAPVPTTPSATPEDIPVTTQGAL